MRKSKLSIFSLQQRLSRPGTTVVICIFSLGYLLYLFSLLAINMQKGWYSIQESPLIRSTIYAVPDETYTFEYFFRSYDNYFTGFPNNSTTPFLVRSEIIFLGSLIAIVLALTLAHIKARKSGGTINRLSLPIRSIRIMQWLSDCVYTLLIWLLHLVVIFLFYIVYVHSAPVELTYPQNLYTLFIHERYLYLIFPVLNPVSIIRMSSLVLAVSFLPSVISMVVDDILDGQGFSLGMLFQPGVLAGLICWGFFSSNHIWSTVACAAAMIVGFLCFKHQLPKGAE